MRRPVRRLREHGPQPDFTVILAEARRLAEARGETPWVRNAAGPGELVAWKMATRAHVVDPRRENSTLCGAIIPRYQPPIGDESRKQAGWVDPSERPMCGNCERIVKAREER